MHSICVFDHKTNKRIAFLENAYNICYTQEHNALWSAQFTLPLGDPKNKYCDFFNFVEIHDGEKYVGLFRIVPATVTKNESTREIVYECEHVLATLMDDILFGWHEIGNRGVYTTEVLSYILSKQTVQRWQLGECEFSHQYLYGWENENLLTALFSVPNSFVESFCWEFDTKTSPWTLHLRQAPTDVRAEIRYRKNMLGITKTEDPTNLCTRLYPLGYGEGTNQLTIASVNNGQKYLDADTQDRYGIITKIWADSRYQDAQSLYDAATAMLNELKQPMVTYSVDALHNKELLDRNVGDYVRVVDDELNADFLTRIVSVQKSDITAQPGIATITLANKSKDVASSIADLSDRQRVAATYSQGAVTLFTTHFYDNCAEDYPAQLRFYIPENVVHINQILLNCNAAAFRGYTKATKGGGERSATTSDGGGSYTSTGSGGGSSTTSSSGGGSTTSSSAAGSASITSSTGVDQYGRTIIPQDVSTSVADGHSHTYKYVSGHYHKISVSNHSHTVSVPSHSHSVSIPSHSHTVSIAAHSHSFTLPDHTHEITYGIYSGSSADKLKLKVDSTSISTQYGSSISDLDIVQYLSKDDSGNVQRGWHTIQITPDKLTRVECDLVIQLFANSRGGGQY